MDLKLFGDIIMMLMIIAAPVIFIKANLDYEPQRTEERDEKRRFS